MMQDRKLRWWENEYSLVEWLMSTSANIGKVVLAQKLGSVCVKVGNGLELLRVPVQIALLART